MSNKINKFEPGTTGEKSATDAPHKRKNTIITIVSLLIVVAFAVMMIVFGNQGSPDSPDGPQEPSNPPAVEVPDASPYLDRDVTGRNVAYVTMQIKDYGTVKLLLDATSAPRTVAQFLTLAKSGFYDGLDFYSAQMFSETSSVILSGDPSVNGGKAYPETIKGEFAYNEIENDLKIRQGVISMFHSQNSLDDASSAFFFANNDIPSLDGYYAPFGYVISGYKVIDEIVKVGTYYTEPNTGLILKNRRPVIKSVRVDQDIDYSLISDLYLAPPTGTELSELLGENTQADRINVSYAPVSVVRGYAGENDCALQLTSDSDAGFANLLLRISKDGKILGASALSLTSEAFLSEISSLVDLDSLAIDAAELPDELKAMAKDALRTAVAVFADGSSSKYVYIRDTEGRETYTVEMKVEGYDTPVVILLDKTTAPITVANFLSLVEKGFYDGLDFHRIIKGFMIQGGDDSHLPKDQQAASIKGEFAANGHENDIRHIRGTISMARSNIMDSASSGFFICDADAPHLDGGYAAFGYVISGMATVDAIADYAMGKTDSNGNLNTGVEQPKIEYIKILDNH